MQSEAEITSDELRMLPEHTELLIMHWKRIRNALVSVGRTDQISTPLKHSLTASLTLSLCQGPAICYLWRAINVSCITNHTDPIVCVLFSYLCLVEKWLSIPSKQHLLVSHVEDFSPRVVMPMWKHSMSLNIFDWKGNRVSVYVCVWEREFDHLSAFVWGVRAYFCTQHHGLHYNMGHASVIYLEEMKWACPEAYIVCGFACWMYLCVAEARCACAICVEKIPTGAFLQLPGNLWKASQRNRGLVGEDAQTWKPAV